MDTFGNKGKEKATDDALFLERLDMLFEQSLADIRAFAERECRAFDEVRVLGNGGYKRPEDPDLDRSENAWQSCTRGTSSNPPVWRRW